MGKSVAERSGGPQVSDPCDMTAEALGDAFARRRLSPVEAATAALAATEANCQMIETVADYIEERYANDAYATG